MRLIMTIDLTTLTLILHINIDEPVGEIFSLVLLGNFVPDKPKTFKTTITKRFVCT